MGGGNGFHYPSRHRLQAPEKNRKARPFRRRLGLPGVDMQYRTPNQLSIDGNSVEMDTERARFADNAVRYEASLRFLSGQIKTLTLAIQGQ